VRTLAYLLILAVAAVLVMFEIRKARRREFSAHCEKLREQSKPKTGPHGYPEDPWR